MESGRGEHGPGVCEAHGAGADPICQAAAQVPFLGADKCKVSEARNSPAGSGVFRLRFFGTGPVELDDLRLRFAKGRT